MWLLCCVTVLAVLAPAASAAPSFGGCPVFPREIAWNQPVANLPVLPGSGRMIGRIGANDPLHPDWGSQLWNGGLVGVPFNVIGGSTSAVATSLRARMSFDDPAGSDQVPYPIPSRPLIEAAVRNPDRHMIVVDRQACRLYEFYRARQLGARRWHVGSAATWDLRSARLRADGLTSADAAGLPMFPLMVRHDEVRRGAIDHALRIVVPRTRHGWIYPARHTGTFNREPGLPVMGQRLRLKRSINPASFPPQARPVVRALQRYGAIVADEGASWHLTGAPSRAWDMAQVYALERIKGRDFEVVDTRRLPRP